MGFLGPNGAGKSTTMQILAGTLAPSIGEVHIAGYDMLDNPLQAKAAIGYLPEQPPLYKDMQVDEFLRFCARLHKMSSKTMHKALQRAIDKCGLGSVVHRLIGNLSKGYQQRVGIAQAILHSPAVVILDEPTVGLDPIQIREIRDLIRELGQEHSVILSTHILPEVQAVCNHVQIIHQGSLVLNSTLQDLLNRQHHQLTIALQNCPSIETLQTLPGVQQVEMLDAQRARLIHDTKTETAQAVVEQSVTHDWGLFELIPEQESLEQVFVELTQGENAIVVEETTETSLEEAA